MLEPTQRFSDRVDNYSKYRPGYPTAIISYLMQATGIRQGATVADIGSGTGIFTDLLLRHGFTVKAVEPNGPMRQAAEENLGSIPGFTSIEGSAEHTTLNRHSVELITVAQAFHWMEPLATKKEFTRILKPGGYIALLWNIRTQQTPFMQAYEALKAQFGSDYASIHKADEAAVGDFFSPAKYTRETFSHVQLLDMKGLKGHLLSSSYIPVETHPLYPSMMEELEHLFHSYQENGLVRVDYECKVYLGKAR